MINREVVKGILENIKNKVPILDWDFVSKYHNGEDISIMELRLFRKSTTNYIGQFTFESHTGRLIGGKYGKTLNFENTYSIIDALLEVLSLEIQKKSEIALS